MYNFCDFTFRVQRYNIFLDCANILCKNIKKALLQIAKSRQNHVYCLTMTKPGNNHVESSINSHSVFAIVDCKKYHFLVEKCTKICTYAKIVVILHANYHAVVCTFRED